MKNMLRSVKYVIGIDEVGRGPVAGPVAVGVVASALPAGKLSRLFRTVKDSKKLSARKREEWFARIKEEEKRGVLTYHVSFVSSQGIDRHGISYALKKAMERSLMKLACDPKTCRILLDGGLVAPEEYVFQKTIIKGDEKEPLIALASIAAKVLRDRKMVEYGKRFPEYLFSRHKGYGTEEHMKRIKQYGISPIHRKSFLKGIVLK
ncbi:MAG: ribonuclease HII [Candidatus Yonathbacteria bacterium]|nr:ribonuclease HII [Candidatus Yonathbacteria bacterium]